MYCGAGVLHAAFHFGLVKCRWRTRHFLKAVQDWYRDISPESWPTFVMNNHDVPRSATRFGHGEDDERLKVAAAFLLTQRGTPFLYYGEEIGMRDIALSRYQIKDKVGRYFWPFYKGRDGCRSPMQWDNTKNAGFSSIEPWLPVHSNYHHRNVELQQQDPNSLLNFYKDLINLRKSIPALQRGLFLPMNHEPSSILAYVRQTKDQLVLVALNFSRRSLNLVLGRYLAKFSWELLI